MSKHQNGLIMYVGAWSVWHCDIELVVMESGESDLVANVSFADETSVFSFNMSEMHCREDFSCIWDKPNHAYYNTPTFYHYQSNLLHFKTNIISSTSGSRSQLLIIVTKCVSEKQRLYAKWKITLGIQISCLRITMVVVCLCTNMNACMHACTHACVCCSNGHNVYITLIIRHHTERLPRFWLAADCSKRDWILLPVKRRWPY